MKTRPELICLAVSDFCPRTKPLGRGCVRLHAPAKINLNLLVARPRSDGFHPLDSFVAKISFYDRLELRLRSDERICLACEGIDCGSAAENLAMKAAKALAAAAGRPVAGVDILLDKQIPPGGGLGGGSSDAAAVLVGLSDLWSLDLPAKKLADLAAGLGSDVPLFLGQAASQMTGRGEIIEPIDVYPFWVILILPGLVCPTGQVYRVFDATPTEAEKQLDPTILTQPPSQWRPLLVNQLQRPAMQLAPGLANLRDALAAATNLPVNISGSGSTLFILCDDQAEAREAGNRIPRQFQSLCRIARLSEF